jgi:hypothetical protein
MAVSEPTKRVVAFRSGNLCAFPECLQELVESATPLNPAIPIGEAAHIAGERPTAARYDPTMTQAQRDSAENLIYMCPTHHTVIDGQPETYTRAMLLELKAHHESQVGMASRAAKIRAMSAVGFAEFHDVVEALATASPYRSPTLTLTMPEEKLSRNDLGPNVRNKVMIGLAKARDVEDYFNTPIALERGLADTVTARFRAEYEDLFNQDLRGDDLFDALEVFATRGQVDLNHQAAALAIVVYLFEKCDLFEP